MPSNFVPVAAAVSRSDHDRWLPVRDGQVLLLDDFVEGLRPLRADEAAQLGDDLESPIVIGRIEGEESHWWTANVGDDFDPFEAAVPGLLFTELRAALATLDPVVWNIAGRATQLVDWINSNRFCGRCGQAMVRSETERALRCSCTSKGVYPRLSPAAIVLVLDDQDRALLARNVAWSMPMFSTLAGFVEPGESLEECIHREIGEEVGVRVRDVEYFGSQPWPFPNSLMVGFFARHESGDLRPDPAEIAEANWFSRDELPMIPPRGSIARALIDKWLNAR